MEDSPIEWTDHTFNPWWGCCKISPGCLHCYAKSVAHRYGHDVWGKGKPRRTFGDQHWKQALTWNVAAEKAGERAKVFCASMADVFDPEAPETERQRLWRLIEQTPWLDWQLLTKRPELATRFLPAAWLKNPRPNVWIGVSVEDRKRKSRIDVLRTIPAAVRFLSIEPLLEDLGEIDLAGMDWVIVGGESGPGARPMNEAWVTGARDQCASAGVAFFFKQWGKLKNNPDQNDPTAKENGGAVKGGGQLSGRLSHAFSKLAPISGGALLTNGPMPKRSAGHGPAERLATNIQTFRSKIMKKSKTSNGLPKDKISLAQMKAVAEHVLGYFKETLSPERKVQAVKSFLQNPPPDFDPLFLHTTLTLGEAKAALVPSHQPVFSTERLNIFKFAFDQGDGFDALPRLMFLAFHKEPQNFLCPPPRIAATALIGFHSAGPDKCRPFFDWLEVSDAVRKQGLGTELHVGIERHLGWNIDPMSAEPRFIQAIKHARRVRSVSKTQRTNSRGQARKVITTRT